MALKLGVVYAHKKSGKISVNRNCQRRSTPTKKPTTKAAIERKSIATETKYASHPQKRSMLTEFIKKQIDSGRIEDLLQEFTDVKAMEKLVSGCKKIAPSRRTVAVKVNRITEAKKAWDNFTQIIADIEANEKLEINQYYQTEKEHTTKLYTEYIA